MHGTSRAELNATLFLAMLLVGAGAIVGVTEARSYLAGGSSQRERFDILARGGVDTGLSVAARNLLLKNCLDTMASLTARAQPGERRHAVQSNCMAIADRIVEQEPTSALAWYVGAVAAAALSDLPGMAKRLGEAQRTGPTEQWLAQMRVELAEENYAALPADVLAGHKRDLTLLVQSQDGVGSIARRYVQQPDFRLRITTLVEELPPAFQERFLVYVQQFAQAAGAL